MSKEICTIKKCHHYKPEMKGSCNFLLPTDCFLRKELEPITTERDGLLGENKGLLERNTELANNYADIMLERDKYREALRKAVLWMVNSSVYQCRIQCDNPGCGSDECIALHTGGKLCTDLDYGRNCNDFDDKYPPKHYPNNCASCQNKGESAETEVDKCNVYSPDMYWVDGVGCSKYIYDCTDWLALTTERDQLRKALFQSLAGESCNHNRQHKNCDCYPCASDECLALHIEGVE